MAYSSTKKKSAGIVQISIGILTVILVVLIIAMMMIVSSIQGTARIVNYAGLVRGKTQRIVKLEISGKQEDDMIQEIESFIDGLMNGNKELNLVRLEDSDFQTKMEELNEYFLMLKQEIMQVRMELIKHRLFQRVNIFLKFVMRQQDWQRCILRERHHHYQYLKNI